MKRNLMLLNIALLGLVSLLGWYLKQKWDEELQQEHKVETAKTTSPLVIAPPPLKKVGPIDAPSYGEVATKNLFSADRNPNPIPDPPKPPPPPPKMPPLPVAYGVMLWDGVPPTVVLSDGKSEQKGYHAGDKIGEFTVISVSNKEVVFEWNGEKVSKRLDELLAKNQPAPAGPPQAAPAAPPAQPPSTSLSGPVNGPGPENGGVRMCNPGDTSPVGTVVDGYVKKVTPTPFNPNGTCRWEPAR